MKKPKLKKNKHFTGYKKLKHVKMFEQYIKEWDDEDEEYDEEDEEGGGLDYNEIEWKMDKYMSEAVEDQDEYYDILYSGDAKELEEYFERAMADEERFNSYLGPDQSLKGFCEYLVEKHKKPEKYIDTPEIDSEVETLEELFEIIKKSIEESRLKDDVTFSTEEKDLGKEDTIVLTEKSIKTEGFGTGFEVTTAPRGYFSYEGQLITDGTAGEIAQVVFRRIKWHNQDW